MSVKNSVLRDLSLVATIFAVLAQAAEPGARSLEAGARQAAPGDAGLGSVDFRYSPPWWQSPICLPDDPDPALVGKEGQLFFDFDRALAAPRHFALWVEPGIAEGARWLKQETLSARAPIVQTWMDAAGVEVLEEVFVVTSQGRMHQDAQGQASLVRMPERRAVVLVTLKNNTGAVAVRRPVLRIRSVVPVHVIDSGRAIMAGEGTRIFASELMESDARQASTNFQVRVPEVNLKPGATHQVVFTIDRHSAKAQAALSVEEARLLRDAARQWWEKSDLPFDVVQVPDPGIQAMVESSVRNIWQAREIVGGKVAFHSGLTIYRDLSAVDGPFILEAATILGRARDARDGIEYLLSLQEADGSFAIVEQHPNLPGYGKAYGFWKENGVMLWGVSRHAQLTQDKKWLQAKWPALQRVVEVIQRLRMETRKNPDALDYGLMPGGYVDGGIDNRLPKSKPDFSNDYWNLAGLKAAIAAAHWLGDAASAAAWQQEFDDFYSTYRKAAERDTLKDPFGNRYVPTMMANAEGHAPARGQWAFCHAVYPGAVFPVGDPLLEGQLAMLRATKVQGMVFDTGWMKQGIWTYFASFYGHAVLWDGRGHEAAESLYDFARHASPMRVWREEQAPVGKGTQEVGDMPHNWGSAEFIRLATHLIELDRGDELHLLEGFPREWAAPGMVTRLNGVLTPFGPLRLELLVSADGRSARLKLGRLTGSKPAKIVLHLAGLIGEDKTMELPAGRDIDRVVKLNRF